MELEYGAEDNIRASEGSSSRMQEKYPLNWGFLVYTDTIVRLKSRRMSVGWECVTYGAEENIMYGFRVENLWKGAICKT
jgi:hypothetical protein